MAEPEGGEQHETQQGEDGGGGEQTGSGGGDAGGGAGGGFTDEQLAAIREVIRDVLAGADENGGSEGAGEGGGSSPTGGRLIDEERRIEARVRKELERIRLAEGVGDLKEQVRRIVEQPPKRYRRTTTVMWGRGEDE